MDIKIDYPPLHNWVVLGSPIIHFLSSVQPGNNLKGYIIRVCFLEFQVKLTFVFLSSLASWGIMKKVLFQKECVAWIILLEEITILLEEIMIECLFINNYVAKGAGIGEFIIPLSYCLTLTLGNSMLSRQWICQRNALLSEMQPWNFLSSISANFVIFH